MMGHQAPGHNYKTHHLCLEQFIPQQHLLRQIDRLLDFTDIQAQLESCYSHTGRPSIDPELMLRMMLVGYFYGIRSERKLCEEVHFNLAYRWFCKLGLETKIPNHSTFSKARLGRFREHDIIRLLFDSVVKSCIKMGMVKGDSFAVDASFVRADVSRQRAENSPIDWTASQKESRMVKEYLNALDENSSLKRKQKTVSLTDPMAQWSGAKGRAEFYYSTNYMIDIKQGIIMDVEASPSTNALEVGTTKTMIDRVENNHGIVPKRLLGDTAYGAAENLDYLVEQKHIEPHVPVFERPDLSGDRYSRTEFIYIENDDEYVCPNNHRLHTTGHVTKAKTLLYRSRTLDCADCPDKNKCCPVTPVKKITRSIYEKSRIVARAINQSEEYKNISFHQRKKVEMSFAHMKRNLNFTRLRLRGIKNANDEFVLVATAQNLRKMARRWNLPPPVVYESG